MTLYIEVTNDEYELPVAVAESARELAEMRGVAKHTVLSALCKYRKGITQKCKYMKIEVSE